MKRTSFLSAGAAGLSTVSLAATASAATGMVPGGRALVEPRAAFRERAFDAKLGRPVQIRQLWENIAFKPGVFANVKNSLNGLQFGFGYAPDDFMLALANHGPSSVYNWTDGIWEKYRIGEFFQLRDAAGTSVTRNVFLPRHSAPDGPQDPNNAASPFQDTSIEALHARGVLFLACHTAIEEISRGLVKAGHAPAGMSSSDVAADILTHLIPGTIVVPSMVATIAVLQQRYRYTYITVQS